jgi:hypothetical protein
MTTYGGQFPSIRVFEADADSLDILDYKQYRLDLNKANLDTN